MKKLIRRIFPSESKPAERLPVEGRDEQAGITAQSELQSMRMELEARDRRIEQLGHEVARLRERQDGIIAETVTARLETLINELSGPASQVRTQAHLSEVQNKPVSAQDVLAVARRMIRTLERHGMTFEGEIGSQISYDPNRHTPINTSTAPSAGSTVTVRFSGVLYQGKIVYKAIVE